MRDILSSDLRELLERRALTGSCCDPLALPVLVVNRVFQPVRLTTVRRAIVLLYTGSAHALGEQGEQLDFDRWRALPVRAGIDDSLRIVSGALRAPRVLHLCRYSRSRRPAIRLTRANLMLRDGYQCQYCGHRPTVRELDIDHVVPRSRGGEESWANLVTACLPCNRRKAHRTPQEAGMPLLRRPAAPRWSIAAQLLVGAPARYQEWMPFLEAS